MKLEKNVLGSILARDKFLDLYSNYAMSVLGEVRFFPRLAKPRIYEAHAQWIGDMQRVGAAEPNLADGLDHFKQCGHLAFWLRRMSPVAELADLDFGDSELPLNDRKKKFRDLLVLYSNEYLAFDLGFQICKFYEIGEKGNGCRAATLTLSPDYYHTTCHFMKYKNVSPHAMHLVYRSLFAHD